MRCCLKHLLSDVPPQTFHVPANGGAEKMAQEMGAPFLGRIPLDPSLGRAAEEGRSAVAVGAAVACAPAVQRVVAEVIAALEG